MDAELALFKNAAARGADAQEVDEIMSLINMAPPASPQSDGEPPEARAVSADPVVTSLNAIAESFNAEAEKAAPSASWDSLTMDEEESFRAAALAGRRSAGEFQSLIDLAPDVPAGTDEGATVDDTADDVPVSEKKLFYFNDDGERVFVPFQRPPPELGFPGPEGNPVQQYTAEGAADDHQGDFGQGPGAQLNSAQPRGSGDLRLFSVRNTAAGESNRGLRLARGRGRRWTFPRQAPRS
eukprot:scaffold825_cov249-Pinguiococcus_pyrenoidosus.AAC.41